VSTRARARLPGSPLLQPGGRPPPAALHRPGPPPELYVLALAAVDVCGVVVVRGVVDKHVVDAVDEAVEVADLGGGEGHGGGRRRGGGGVSRRRGR
jgi:hypothetical protein